MFDFTNAIVPLFTTATITNSSEFSPQMKALRFISAVKHPFTTTHMQVQRKCIPLSGVQMCHGFPLLSSHPFTQWL